MAEQREWVIDGTMGYRDGMFCYCPVERDDSGEITAVISGLMYLSDTPPHGEPVIAVVHEDGQKACEQFCDEHADALIKARGQVSA